MKPNWYGVSTEPTSGILAPGKYRLRVYDTILQEDGSYRIQFTVVGTDRNGWKISDWISIPVIDQWDDKDIQDKKKFRLSKARHLLHRLGIDTEKEFDIGDAIGHEIMAQVEIREKQTGGKVNSIALFSYEPCSFDAPTPPETAEELEDPVGDSVPF
jgi:hypothetical protein